MTTKTLTVLQRESATRRRLSNLASSILDGLRIEGRAVDKNLATVLAKIIDIEAESILSGKPAVVTLREALPVVLADIERMRRAVNQKESRKWDTFCN